MALNRVQGVLTAYLNRLQEVENGTFGLLSAMSITAAAAAGASDLLNKIGAIVGEVRNARTDADYAAGIKLRVRVNVATGRSADLLDIARLAYAPLLPNYVEPGDTPGWIIDMPYLGIGGRYIAQQIRRARPAGVPGVVSFSPVAANNVPFLWDSTVTGAVALPGKFDDVGGDITGPGSWTVGFTV